MWPKKSDLIAPSRCVMAALMNSSVCFLGDKTMTSFGWAVEDVVR
jgi:hypothetical protein